MPHHIARWTGIYLLLVVLLTSVTPERETYRGHRVIRAVPRTLAQLHALRRLSENAPQEVDVWSTPRQVGESVDIQLHPSHYRRTVRWLHRRSIPVETIHYDLQQSVDKHLQANAEAGTGDYYDKYHNFTEIASHGKPKIWIDSLIHAREWISGSVMMYTIERLLNDYQTDNVTRLIVDSFDWYFQPVVNPDGYVHSWEKERLWRKTRSFNNGSTCMGSDANRNFDFKWGTVGVGWNPCSNTYPGKAAFSEPETKAQADFILRSNGSWAVFLTLHSYSQLFLLPYGYTYDRPEHYEKLMVVGRKAADALKGVNGMVYRVDSASRILYRSSGTSRDWARGVPNIKYVFTLELRDEGQHRFLLPPEQIRPSVEETYAAFMSIFEDVHQDFKHDLTTP